MTSMSSTKYANIVRITYLGMIVLISIKMINMNLTIELESFNMHIYNTDMYK